VERKTLIVGNWKMNKDVPEALVFAQDFCARLEGLGDVDVAVCPPFTAMAALKEAFAGSGVMLGAQNVFYEDRGAFTGEVSPGMLKDLGCRFVIIGHSERRQHMKETDKEISRKVQVALRHDLTPILCVGEDLKQREMGRAQGFVRVQVDQALVDLSSQEVGRMVIAYEPIWAIGTGRTPSSDAAEEMCQTIRTTVAGMAGAVAQHMRILYGGSVQKENIAQFVREPNIDGALVGGASLQAADFRELIAQAQAR
jgi:triosephosphate isomerase